MDVAPTPSTPSRFAVGYGNGYGYDTAPAGTVALPGTSDLDRVTPVRGGHDHLVPADLVATVAVTRDDLQAALALATAPAPAPAHPPFAARPAGAAHPRRRFDRGLAIA